MNRKNVCFLDGHRQSAVEYLLVYISSSRPGTLYNNRVHCTTKAEAPKMRFCGRSIDACIAGVSSVVFYAMVVGMPCHDLHLNAVTPLVASLPVPTKPTPLVIMICSNTSAMTSDPPE